MRAKALERGAPKGEGVLARVAGGNFAGLYAEWQKRRIRRREGATKGVISHCPGTLLQLALLNGSAHFGSFHG